MPTTKRDTYICRLVFLVLVTFLWWQSGALLKRTITVGRWSMDSVFLTFAGLWKPITCHWNSWNFDNFSFKTFPKCNLLLKIQSVARLPVCLWFSLLCTRFIDMSFPIIHTFAISPASCISIKCMIRRNLRVWVYMDGCECDFHINHNISAEEN